MIKLLSSKEIYYIDLFDSYNNGYNATLGGDAKSYLNFTKDEIFNAILNTNNVKEASRLLSIDSHTLKRFAKQYGIKCKISNPQSYKSKVTEEQAKIIKYSDKRQVDLAKEFGVSKFVISRIKRGENWKQL